MKLNLKVNNQISATLIKPENLEAKNPALIFVHGWRSDQTGNIKRAKPLTDLGFIILTIDLRGHGESAGKLEDYSRENHVEDIKAAYDYLSTLPEVDTEKIGIVGSSYGAYLSAVVTNFKKFNKLVLRVPALYFDKNIDIPSAKLMAGDPKAFKSDDLNPKNSLAIKGVSEFKGKALIIEAEKDSIIPHSVIENYLRFAQKNTEYKVMEGAPHSLETEEQEKEYIKILKNWLLKTN